MLGNFKRIAMMPLLSCCGVIFVIAALTACKDSKTNEQEQEVQVPLVESKPDEAAEPDPRRATPEACYEVFHTAWDAGEVVRAFEMLTPYAQQQLAGCFLQLIGFIEPLPEDHPYRYDFVNDGRLKPKSESAQQLGQIFKKRGLISVYRLSNKYQQNEGADISEEEKVEQYRKTFFAMTTEVGPLDQFVDEVRPLFRDQLSNNPRVRAITKFYEIGFYGRLAELAADGDRAKGWYRHGDEGVDVSVDFIKTDSGWLIDQIMPYDMYLPGIGQYRDADGVIHDR